MAIQVRSPVFSEGMPIPRKYTGEGQDVSPPLEWSGVPEGTAEIAVICEDPDAPSPRPFTHWVLTHISPAVSRLPEGKSDGARAGRNDFGKPGYGGPMPPKGHGTHHYHFKVYALDAPLQVPDRASRDEVLKAMEGHVLDEGEIVGTYERG